MAFSWSGKKDVVGSSQASEPCAGDAAAEFEQLTGHLEKLREMFQQANERIAAYLIRRESQSGAASGASGEAASLRERLDALAEMIQRLAAVPSAAAAGAGVGSAVAREPSSSHLVAELKDAVRASVDHALQGAVQATLAELRDSVKGIAADVPRQWAGIESQIRQLQEQSEESLRRLAELAAPPQQESDSQPAVSSGEWEQAILGAALAADPALAFQRQQLLSGVLEGNAGACALAGQLLVFHSSPAERLPQLLKDVGEAYYRWQPKTRPGNTPMEESLVRWLQQNCETAGLANVIELVHPGERFDSSRHAASTRGVEITEVLGWIVLRDNGKVFTKASVVVR